MRERISARTFYAVNRGGGLHSVMINQWGGAAAAQSAARAGIHPSVLTLAALVLGAAAGVALTAIAPVLPDLETRQRVLVAFAAWLAFQAAYSLDCADGQLARVTGQTSPAGGTLDILCDILVQAGFIAAAAQIAQAFAGPLPAWQPALWGAIWMLTLVTSQLDKHGEDVSLIQTGSLSVQVVKMVRDYGAQITAVALLLAVWPAVMPYLLWAFTIINGGYLLVLIARTARRSMSAPASADSQ